MIKVWLKFKRNWVRVNFDEKPESTILISILHTLNMVQNFNFLKNIKKKVGECLLNKDHSIVLGDSTHFRNIYVFVWKINLHESIFKHTTYIEWKEGEEYHSMIIECSLSYW